MPIMRYPTENITMREIYDRYDENIVHILNSDYDFLEAYPDKNIVNDNGEIVGYFYACDDACIMTCGKLPMGSLSCTPDGYLLAVYNERAQKAVEGGSYEDYKTLLDAFAAKALNERDMLIGRGGYAYGI
jgi:hypothetical protein